MKPLGPAPSLSFGLAVTGSCKLLALNVTKPQTTVSSNKKWFFKIILISVKPVGTDTMSLEILYF